MNCNSNISFLFESLFRIILINRGLFEVALASLRFLRFASVSIFIEFTFDNFNDIFLL